MLKTRTMVAVGILAVVAAAVVYARTRPDPHQRQPLAAGAAPAGAPARLAVENVDELEIIEAGKPPVRLAKQDGAWKLVAPVADAADEKNVAQALKVLAELAWKDVVAESKDSHEQLQIRDEDSIRVTAKQAGAPLAVLTIGKGGHVRVGDEARVWSVGKMNRFAFAREAKMWRHREVFRFEKDQVDRLEVVTPTEAGVMQQLVARREPPPPEAVPSDPAAEGAPPKQPAPEKWTLVEGAALVGGPLDESAAGAMVTALSRLDVAEFADDATPASAGLDAPRARVAVLLTGGTRLAIELGQADGGFAFARVEGTTRIFKLRQAAADTLIKPPLQWRDKTLARLPGKEVARIEIVKGGERVAFERDGESWKALAPAAFPELDPARVQGVAASFANLRAAQIATIDARDARAGLARPTGTLTLWKTGGAAPALVITVGALVDKAYYVRVSGRPEVFTLPDVTVNRWLKGVADFKKAPPAPAGIDPHAH